MKKVFLISGFETYSERVKYIEKRLRENFEVQVILSDYKHFSKEKVTEREINKTQVKYIETREYKGNISFDRILSHYFFSRDVYKILKEENPEVVYALIPPNFLAYYLNKFAKKSDSKVILDIIDLWPEAFPVNKFKNNPIFNCWKNLRNNSLDNVSAIVTESEYFQKFLPKNQTNKMMPILLAREPKEMNIDFKSDGKINLCYLGSINNIIDSQLIVDFCVKLSSFKEVKLHIIGDGEKTSFLLNQLEQANINTEYYGKIYDENEKQKIFSKCSFAFNVMKRNVEVGLTMKSLDYFEYGIPLINSIQGDTYNIVKKYNCGYNCDNSPKSIQDTVARIIELNENEVMEMRKSSRRVFDELLTIRVFNDKIDNLMKFIGE